MINYKYKKFIIILLLSFSVISFQPALAQTNKGSYKFSEQSGLEKTGDKAGYSEKLQHLNPTNTVGKIVKLVLTFLGVLFIGLMIYGGLQWMLARGNEQEIQKAKDLITGAIIGLVIVLFAYALTYFIVQYFSTQALDSGVA